jgi:hypothetical protein
VALHSVKKVRPLTVEPLLTAGPAEDGCLSAPGSAEDSVLSTTNSERHLSAPPEFDGGA